MHRLGFLVLALVVACQAQIPFLGGCPAVTAKQDFVPAQYLGKWYEQEKYFAIFQFGGKCVTATYNTSDGTTVNVFNKQINVLTGAPMTIAGTATSVGAANDGRLSVVFPSVPFQIPAPYWVLETDYTTYAVVYSCNDFLIFNTKFVWLLTRDRVPSLTVMQTAYGILDAKGISRAFLLRTDQVNCPADT